MATMNNDFFNQMLPLLEKLQNGMLVLQVEADGSYQIVYANDVFLNLVGYTLRDLRQSTDYSLSTIVHLPDYSTFRLALERANEIGYTGNAYRLINSYGDFVWVLGHHKRAVINDETFISIVYSDINELMATQLELRASNTQWEDIVNSIPIGFCIFSIENNIVNTIAVNQTFVSFSNEIGQASDGYSRNWERDQLIQLFNNNLFVFCKDEDVHKVSAMLTESESIPVAQCQFRFRGSTEENEIWIVSYCHSKALTASRRIYYVSFQDITKEKQQELEIQRNHESLYQLSYHDALTGVKNRNAYERIIAAYQQAPQSSVGVLFADINGLKTVNDTLGHMYGDRMIIKFADILKKEFPLEQIFRISGDEFVVMAPDTDREVFAAHVQVLLDEVMKCDHLASMGYIWKDKVSDVRRRVDQAEQLMYVEKQKYYEEKKNATSKHRPVLLNQLLQDLNDGNFMMYLQPKSNIQDFRIIGAEALVRKLDSNGKILAPYEFIPQFEQLKLIPKIDFFMLEEVCKLLQQFYLEEKTPIKISVNMSRVTMAERDFIDTVTAICNRYTFNKDYLEFEITESNKTMDHQRLEQDVMRLRQLGVGISLDDVGTEYSSFPMLTLEGIDTVKLDRSFITQIKHPKVNKLLKHVVDMCHDLGLSVIAEGVETDADRIELQKLDCDMYQGYLLSKPIPVEDFLKKLN